MNASLYEDSVRWSLELVFDKVVWTIFSMGFFDGDVCRIDQNLGSM